MKEYLFEMHSHTSQTSPCSEVPAENIVKTFKELGYNGVVITDHMSRHSISRAGDVNWEKKADYFLSGYKAAKALEDENFRVLPGMEIRFTENDNDYLVYGFDEDFIYSHENLHLIARLEDFREIANECGLLIFQAHPFRRGMTIKDYRLLDGIEIYNGHPGHNSSNDIALAWAEKYGLRRISGSDYHGELGMPGGLWFDRNINSSAELVNALRRGNYRLKTDKSR